MSGRVKVVVEGTFDNSRHSVLIDFEQPNVLWRRFDEREDKRSDTLLVKMTEVDHSKQRSYLLGISDSLEVERFFVSLSKALNVNKVRFFTPHEHFIVVPVRDKFWYIYFENSTLPVYKGIHSVFSGDYVLTADSTRVQRDEIYALAGDYLFFTDKDAPDVRFVETSVVKEKRETVKTKKRYGIMYRILKQIGDWYGTVLGRVRV